MPEVHTPLCSVLNEIVKAAESGFPFLAVSMTVALPDICVSLQSKDGRTYPDRYKKWCKENIPVGAFGLTPEDLYSLRRGVLHNGRFGDLKHSFKQVVFALPNEGQTFVNCIVNDAYLHSVIDFCKRFTAIVHGWMAAHVNDPYIQANLPRLMQYRELPAIKGGNGHLKVIA